MAPEITSWMIPEKFGFTRALFDAAEICRTQSVELPTTQCEISKKNCALSQIDTQVKLVGGFNPLKNMSQLG